MIQLFFSFLSLKFLVFTLCIMETSVEVFAVPE